VTMPSLKELKNPETKDFVNEFFSFGSDEPTENILKVHKLLQHVQNARPGDVQKWIASQPPSEQLRNEIWVAVPDWSYAPATPPAVTGLSVASVKIPPGKAAAFDTVRKDFVRFRQKIAYPYPVRAFRVVLGEPRIVFVTSFDSRSAFFGANALMAIVEKAGAQSDWQALQARLSGTMSAEWDVKLWNYNEAVSYIPQP